MQQNFVGEEAPGHEQLPYGLEETAPGALKTMSKDKLDKFNKGFQLKNKFKEDQRAKELKKKREDIEAARAYEAFVKSFETDDDAKGSISSMFVRGGAAREGRHSASSSSASKRAPAAKMDVPDFLAPAPASASHPPQQQSRGSEGAESLARKRASSVHAASASVSKKRRQIDAFLQEIKLKHGAGSASAPVSGVASSAAAAGGGSASSSSATSLFDSRGSYDTGDPSTTNLYAGNLHPQLTEQGLFEIFSRYGRIGSIKIMWPRKQEEFERGINSGFVCFMRREDAARALADMLGRPILGMPIRLGWGKAVPLPSRPVSGPLNNMIGGAGKWASKAPSAAGVVVPPPVGVTSLLGLLGSDSAVEPDMEGGSPPLSPSGGSPSVLSSLRGETGEREGERAASQEDGGALLMLPSDAERIEIELPQDKVVRQRIDQLARSVAKATLKFPPLGGFMLEAEVARRERGNPDFAFLASDKGVEPHGGDSWQLHLYYCWRVYSLCQDSKRSRGERGRKHRLAPFQMLSGGAFYVPPAEGGTSGQGQPSSSGPATGRQLEQLRGQRRKQLSSGELRRWEDILSGLVNDQRKIRHCMGFALDRAEKAAHVCEMLTNMLCARELPLARRLALLHALSDILYNSSASIPHASLYRSELQMRLPEVFQALHAAHLRAGGRITANLVRDKVLAVLRVWEAWAVFPGHFCADLEAIFEGRAKGLSTQGASSLPLQAQQQLELKGALDKTSGGAETEGVGEHSEDEEAENAEEPPSGVSVQEATESTPATSVVAATSSSAVGGAGRAGWMFVGADAGMQENMDRAGQLDELDEDLDGVPLAQEGAANDEADDLDGIPLSEAHDEQAGKGGDVDEDESLDGVPLQQ